MLSNRLSAKTLYLSLGFIVGSFILLRASLPTPGSNTDQTNVHTKVQALATHQREQIVPFYAALCDELGRPSKLFLQFCNLLGLKHDGTMRGINRAAQIEWIRTGERWEQKPSSRTGDEQKQGAELLKKCGFIDAIMPRKQEYDYIIIMGGTVGRMCSRVEWLIKLQQSGLVTSKNPVILLTGSRPLDPKIEDLDFAKTECDAMEKIAKEASLTNYRLVNTPMFTNAEGKVRRPTTDDTIRTWLATNPHPGNVLVISNLPYAQQQGIAFLSFVSPRFGVDVSGPEASPSLNFDTHLDNVARTIYALCGLLEKEGKFAPQNASTPRSTR